MPKKVLIAGGGPGGMQAALTAAQRGHQVTLCEKDPSFGGRLRFVTHVPFKADIAYWLRRMEENMAALKVDVRLNTEATPAFIDHFAADVLIIAVGADPIIPPIPGIDHPHIVLGTMLFDKPFDFGEDVVIIGGGLVGCEAAVELKNRGRRVTLVEMLSRVAMGCGEAQSNSIRVGLMDVKTMVNTKCLRITNEGVWVQTEGQGETLLPADSVVLSVGMKSRSTVVEELQQALVPESFVIGDGLAARKMGSAIREGYYTAMNL
jgi:NADPH-dependent 2,4-dienoyl-CoA reductase/sulfur reductase-like enzyme